ncbi:MAG: sensor histidine kinase [Nocardioides sp.]
MTREDELREQAIEAYHVLDQPPRRELEALVELAAKFTGMPMATINLFTATQQWQVATYGFAPVVCAREDSLCHAVLGDGKPILLADASLDDRFRDNPFTTGELARIRFYASYPLVTPEGIVLGTLCVFDEEVRDLDHELEHTLATLAGRVVDVLQLELTSRQLEAANERLFAFAGQVSHDLRNPLSAVRMSLELVHQELGDDGDEALLNLLERAERSTRRMNDMIGELLTFARVGAALEPAEVDLTRVVHAVMEDLAGAATADQIVVGELPTVWGDSVQLRVLLQNLLANAVKFSPPGTPVKVSAVPVDSGWRISVADRGPGVPVEKRERVFEPMVRLDTRVPGTGIGLATCRRIVGAHGGRIGVAENPDGGAALWFELPARPR